MKLTYRNGSGLLVETTPNGGLTAQGEEILEQMQEDDQAGHVESNFYLVPDTFDFDNQDAEA